VAAAGTVQPFYLRLAIVTLPFLLKQTCSYNFGTAKNINLAYSFGQIVSFGLIVCTQLG
jgi:hypothetical protein